MEVEVASLLGHDNNCDGCIELWVDRYDEFT